MNGHYEPSRASVSAILRSNHPPQSRDSRAEWAESSVCVEVCSVNVGKNEHQGIAKHTGMSRRLIVYDMDRHYEPSLAHAGAVLDHRERFCTHRQVSHIRRIAHRLHVHFTVNVNGNGQGGVWARWLCSRSFLRDMGGYYEASRASVSAILRSNHTPQSRDSRTGSVVCVEVCSVSVGENQHHGTVKNTDMPRRLIVSLVGPCRCSIGS